MQAMIIEERITPDNWRARTYQRTDGTTFQTAAPLHRNKDFEGWYDEIAEAKMVLSLNVDKAEVDA